MSVDERDGEKDDLESWLRHALLRAPPAVDAERRTENGALYLFLEGVLEKVETNLFFLSLSTESEEPRVSSSSSVTAPSSSFVKSNSSECSSSLDRTKAFH